MDLTQLTLDHDRLEEIRAALRERIGAGLRRDGEEIAALPAFVGPPARIEGLAAVIDIGGTNVRAAVVDLGTSPQVIAGPTGAGFDAWSGAASSDEFFEIQAALLARLAPPPELPVGYCFSYPSESRPDLDARLLRWTKGIAIPGVEGELVGAGLRRGLERHGLRPPRVCVVNDTVATLLAGSTLHEGEDRSRAIGLVAGTGTNMSTFFARDRCPKAAGGPPRIAVNLESGNFNPPHLTEADERLDRASVRPGTQRFEKAVSGRYLGELLGCLGSGLAAAAGSAELVALRDHGAGPSREAARAILARSADLTAAALAAVLDFHGDGEPVSIFAEGSLFWGDAAYRPRVGRTLAGLVAPERWRIAEHLEDANLVGAACAAVAG